MEFLKNLFANGPLTYDQLAEAVSKAGMNVVDLSSGAYVAKDKFDNRVNTLTQQIADLNGQGADGYVLYRYGSLYGSAYPDLAAAECAAVAAANGQ